MGVMHGGIIRRHGKTSGGDGYVHELDGGEFPACIHMAELFTLNMHSLSYDNYTSVKLF